MARRVKVILRDNPPSRSLPTDTGVAFLATIPLKGVFKADRPITSLDQLEQVHGGRQSFSVCWAWCETFFREGGHTLYLSPVRGPAAAKASAAVPGSVSGTALTLNASSAGEWANGATGGLSYQIVVGPSGGTNRQIVILLNSVEVDRSAEFTVNTDAPAALANSDYVDPPVLGAGTGLVAAGSETDLTGGTLDRTNITQTQVDAALAVFSRDLGPGQVAAPDWQTTACQLSLDAHADANNRWAVPDGTDQANKSTLLSAGNAVQGNVHGAAGNAICGTWLSIKGSAGDSAVPMSAFLCAKAAQTDAAAGPAQAPAGRYGQATSSIVTGVRWPGGVPFTDQDQADLEAAGVAVCVQQFGTVMIDTNRSQVEPLGPDKIWLQASAARLRMAIVAQLEAAGGPFAHRKITAHTIAEFDTTLSGIMQRFELNDQLLLEPGEQPGDSWIVDTGPNVNTPETIAAGELNANVAFRPTPGADFVTIYLTAVAATDAVAA